ncbi:hypothetical protein PVL30_005173 [Lodderomyces elongisporus]|uniref:uncharacterized protein n=1 Tax=Lodderomyces elongisporus TaxID=36914 RepID=UPI00291FF390|nr:uncharacterized protein PVL30_005173 [Lodderomyces elongisporus]WLF81376.1 hypothetical protein PVL30_005173 [Lodderomyces elongisporus]
MVASEGLSSSLEGASSSTSSSSSSGAAIAAAASIHSTNTNRVSTETSATAATNSSQSKMSSRTKVNEFNDGRVTPSYSWKESWNDWFKHSFSSNYTDAKVESRLLNQIKFKENVVTSIIDTDIGNGNYIHEFYIQNKSKDTNAKSAASSSPCKEIVLIHGYAASLGLFIDNFELLSRVPGVKIHAIDMLGFGLSSRPKFPSFPSDTKEDIYKVEDWFIDSIESWRKKRGIDKFVLVGHSFGGYLSCAYAMKYNNHKDQQQNVLDKLVLVSPVGVERSKFSLLDDKTTVPQISIEEELDANQEDIVHGSKKESSSSNSSPRHNVEETDSQVPVPSRRRKLFNYMWQHNYSPFSIVRNAGPVKSKMISRWTTHRFAHTYFQNKENFQNMHDYIYRVFNGAGSGEYAITRVLAVGALAKLPLIDRVPQRFVEMKLPTLWMYGDKDWMNEVAGEETVKEINELSVKHGGGKLAQFDIIKNAGHHLYLDNPPDFTKTLYKFLGYT